MNTRFAGENIFLVHRKKDRLQVVHLWFLFQIMGRKKKPESEKATKPGVSLDAECRDILEKIRHFEYEAERSDMNQAQAIRKCIRLAWDLHYAKKYRPFIEGTNVNLLADEPGNETPQDDAANVFTPETSAGGPLTRPITRYQKGGPRKSTT